MPSLSIESQPFTKIHIKQSASTYFRFSMLLKRNLKYLITWIRIYFIGIWFHFESNSANISKITIDWLSIDISLFPLRNNESIQYRGHIEWLIRIPDVNEHKFIFGNGYICLNHGANKLSPNEYEILFYNMANYQNNFWTKLDLVSIIFVLTSSLQVILWNSHQLW